MTDQIQPFVVGGVYVANSLLAVRHSFVYFSPVLPGSDVAAQQTDKENANGLTSPD